MRPNFAEYLRKIYDLTGGELRIINQYEVGEVLALSSKQTDEIVGQLCDSGMIKKIDGNKVVLSPQALYVINKNKTSDGNYLFSVGANGILLSIALNLALRNVLNASSSTSAITPKNVIT